MLPVFEDLLLDRARLGLILREARESVALTVRDVATRADLTNSHISKIELGQIQISADTFVRVCAALCLPPGLVLESCVLVSRGIHQASAFNDPTVLKLATKSGAVDDTMRMFISDFIAGSALAASYLLKSSAPHSLLDRIDFPIPQQRECFIEFAKMVASDLPPLERNLILVNLVTDCFVTLAGLGLLKNEFIFSYVALGASKSQSFPLPWVPIPKPPFFADVIPASNPLATDIRVMIASFKRERRAKAARKKELPHTETSSSLAEVKSQLPSLLDRLKKATAETGKKSELSAFLTRMTCEKGKKIPLASISRWLSGEREPGGEVALQMDVWATAQGYPRAK